MFMSGLFSSQPNHPLQVDRMGLKNLSEKKLSHAFQVSDKNPLSGFKGRYQILKDLGKTLEMQNTDRLGDLFDPLLSTTQDLHATEILNTLNTLFSPRDLLVICTDETENRSFFDGIAEAFPHHLFLLASRYTCFLLRVPILGWVDPLCRFCCFSTHPIPPNTRY